jgi:uncharacterized protein (DUF362 family)
MITHAITPAIIPNSGEPSIFSQEGREHEATHTSSLAPSSPQVAIFLGAASYQFGDAVRQLVHDALNSLNLSPEFIVPGNNVVLKPNWVKEHDERYPGPNQWEHVVTHPAVIEAVILWVAPRLQGKGEIIVCDAPQTDSSFATLRAYCGLDAMIGRCQRQFPDLRIELLDLRPEEWLAVDGVTVKKTLQPGDPLGSTHVHLDSCSEFVGFAGLDQLYGASYDMDETRAHHKGEKHEYLLCRTPMDADVLINLPKLKCHKKVGLTCALKNLVGINANKNWLPHHTEGTPAQGGDQFPGSTVKAKLEHSWMGRAKRILRGRLFLSRLFVPLKKLGRIVFGDTLAVVRSGNWHGNDTCWRMVADLNKCVFYYDGEGKPRAKPLHYLAVVDGIVGGEGNGPMAPDPKPCGVIIAGQSPVAVDCAAAAIMGFDWRAIRMLRGLFSIREKPVAPFAYEDIRVLSNKLSWQGRLTDYPVTESFHFRPHFGWVNAIESK